MAFCQSLTWSNTLTFQMSMSVKLAMVAVNSCVPTRMDHFDVHVAPATAYQVMDSAAMVRLQIESL